jgi:hypothetical protein
MDLYQFITWGIFVQEENIEPAAVGSEEKKEPVGHRRSQGEGLGKGGY